MKEGVTMKKVFCCMLVLVFLVSGCHQIQLHKEIKNQVEEPKIKEERYDASLLVEKSGIVQFVNDIPIIVHKNHPNGEEYGFMNKGERQVYTHIYVGFGHRYIVWQQDGVQCFCAIGDEKNQEPWAIEIKEEVQEVAYKHEDVNKIIKDIAHQYDGTISVYFKDLKTNDVVNYNPMTMYPCSIIKIAVMVSIYHDSEEQNINLEACKPYLESMMIDSNNTSYNYLLQVLGDGDGLKGIQRVNTLLRQFGLQETTLHHALVPGDYFFTDQGTNQSSAKDIGILLESIYDCKVASVAHCDDMIHLMAQCKDQSGLAQGINNTTLFAHKSGWAYNYYLDGGIVYVPNRNYIFVVFTDNVQNNRNLCYDLSNAIYQYEQNSKE